MRFLLMGWREEGGGEEERKKERKKEEENDEDGDEEERSEARGINDEKLHGGRWNETTNLVAPFQRVWITCY